MNIDFKNFHDEFKSLQKLWEEAHKKNDKPKMVAIINTIVDNLETSAEALRSISRMMMKSVMGDIKEEFVASKNNTKQ